MPIPTHGGRIVHAIQEIIDADDSKEKEYKENIQGYIQEKLNLKDLKGKYNSCLEKMVVVNK